MVELMQSTHSVERKVFTCECRVLITTNSIHSDQFKKLENVILPFYSRGKCKDVYFMHSPLYLTTVMGNIANRDGSETVHKDIIGAHGVLNARFLIVYPLMPLIALFATFARFTQA